MSYAPNPSTAASSPRRARYRGRHLPVAALAAVVILTGCSSTSAGDAPSGGKTAADAGFPRTLKTTLGDVTIAKKPQRVVTVGFPTGTADAALVSGVVPVAMPKAVGQPGDVEPWVSSLLGGTKPTLIEANKVDIEQIASLKPDLILAGMHRGIPTDYEKLSKIAPVVTYEGKAAFQDTWQQQTALAGKALGTEEKAAAAVKKVEDKFTAIQAKHPGWKGRTFTFTQGASLAQIPTVTDPNEASARLFSSFGLELAPGVKALGDKREVSSENLAVLNADLVVMFFPSAEAQKTFEANAAFSQIPAVKEGRYITVDSSEAFALISPGVLNVEWAADRIVPRIEKALP
ncbi:iron-siderophore ABC transporter substrate-binding protein [Kitasatospora sp. NPDC094019]|uniref:iron-siderophore ABC transporter substrate-binding protein n=1 Tax=Kitasatospora sp. NPDC094019 TaxID=3364091 RepID=UPI00381DF856